MKEHCYVNIQGWMYKLGFSNLRELVAYALIFCFSQDEASTFNGSISYVEKALLCSRHTAIDVLKSLEDKGYIVKEQFEINGVKFNKYKVSALVVQKLHHPSAKTALNNKRDNNVSSDDDTMCSSTSLCIEEISSTKETSKESFDERTFDEFRRAYKGTKRGLRTEFDNFRKKHKDWREVLTHLMSDYQKQEQIREANGRNGAFVPQPKNLQTYINQRCWEDEIQLAQPQYGKQSNSKFADPQQSMLAIIEGARAGVAERNNAQDFI